MVKEIEIDIFKAPIDVLIHGANIHCTMKSGIAKDIAKLFPEAVEADNRTIAGDIYKLGTYSSVKVNRQDTYIKFIVNLYQQDKINTKGKDFERVLNYEAFYSGLEKLRKGLKTHKYTLGIPYGIGCGLAGGSWKVVRAMIYDIFDNELYDTLICKLPND